MINCGYYTLQRVRKFIDLSLRYNLLIHSIAPEILIHGFILWFT